MDLRLKWCQDRELYSIVLHKLIRF
jgi:hypothetical protein